MPRKPKTMNPAQYADMVHSASAAMWAFRHPSLAQAFLPEEWRDIDLTPVPAKTRITLRVDTDVARFYRKLGDGYQGTMNEVLRAFMMARLVEIFGPPDDPFPTLETDEGHALDLEVERGLRRTLDQMVKDRMGWNGQ